jgi:hypothetical protein
MNSEVNYRLSYLPFRMNYGPLYCNGFFVAVSMNVIKVCGSGRVNNNLVLTLLIVWVVLNRGVLETPVSVIKRKEVKGCRACQVDVVSNLGQQIKFPKRHVYSL